MSSDTELSAALAAGAAIAEPKELKGDYAVLPHGCSMASLERFKQQPDRKRGEARFKREGEFSDYVKAHKTSSTVIFADLEHFSLQAVLDHHDKGAAAAAGWGEHRALCALPIDPDWKTWTDNDDKAMDQVHFAQFLEDNLPAIKKPDGAELLEIAQDLEAKSNVTFKSAERLSDGRRAFTYSDEPTQKVGKGKMELPEEFLVNVPVFRWGKRYDLTAKLRYRIREGQLVLWYHLVRPQDVSDEAFKRVIEAVNVETKTTVWLGAPPKTSEYGTGE